MRRHAATAVAVLVLAASVLVVELGLREPAPGPAAQLPVPARAAPLLDRIRATPFAAGAGAQDAAVASGVVFGRTDHVTPADEEAFLASGLWHLLAASGQNVALVAGCCIVLARVLGAGRVAGTLGALVAVPGYVLVVGGGASIVRAGIMGELALLAWLAGRLGDARHVLVVAAAAICIAWPGAHRGLGMQLSFACVAALMAWVVPLTERLREQGLPGWLAGGIAASVLCSGATAPILLLRTGAAPCTGIAANIVAVPLAGVILVVGLSGAAITLLVEALGVHDAGRVAMVPAVVLAGMLRAMASRAADWPLAQTTSPWLAVGVPVAAFVQAVPLVRARRRLLHGARLALLCCLVAPVVALVLARTPAAAVLTSAPPSLAPGSLRIAMLDVGQGDATLLQAGGHAVLVDTGPPDGRVVDRVRALGVARIDGVVLTHDSLDHRGGLPQVVDRLRPGWVVRPRHALGNWSRVEQVAPRIVELCAGDEVPLTGGIRIDVLHPRCDGTITPHTGDLHNDGAMVLLVRHGGIRAVLPADAEAPVLRRLPLPASLQLLRVSHHGSEDPELARLLAEHEVAAAAISVGEGNDYGHPTPRTLADLRSARVPTWRTDEHGTVAFDSDGATLVVHPQHGR